MKNLLEVQEKLENIPTSNLLNNEPENLLHQNFSKVLGEVKSVCLTMSGRNQDARNLSLILENPHLEALVEAHSNIAHGNYSEARLEESYEMDILSGSEEMRNLTPSAIRMVGIRKSNNEPLGMTVQVEDGLVAIARIFSGGLIEKQGLLHVGDIILEVNGQGISSPEQLQEQLKRSQESVTFKISPSSRDVFPSTTCFMRALFNYDPNQDKLLPCKEVGVEFKQGDILEVLSQEDPNWWQG